MKRSARKREIQRQRRAAAVAQARQKGVSLLDLETSKYRLVQRIIERNGSQRITRTVARPHGELRWRA